MAFNRRTWLIGASALAIGCAATGAIFVFARGDGPAEGAAPSPSAPATSTPLGEPSATAVPSAALTPSPVPVPDLLPYISETPGAWKRETFATGRAPDVRRGMYLLSAGTGETERWTIVTDTPDRDVGHAIVDYWASEDGTWLFAHDGELVRALNRASGRSWAWADANIAMYNALADRLVLENRIFEHRTSGPIVVMDGEMHVAGRCAVGPAYSRQALLSRDGTHVVIVSQPSPPDPNALLEVKDEQPAACDVASGALTAMPGPPATPDHFFYVGSSIGRGADALSLCVFYSYQSAAEITPPERQKVYRLLSLDGRIEAEFAMDPDSGADFSPDGRLVALSASSLVETQGEGATVWLSTVVADARTGRPLFRVQGAWPGSGVRLQGSRWLADSSGFVVMTAGDPADPGANGEPKRFGYQVVSRDGTGARWLPFSSDDRYAAPVPSPVAATVFAIGRNAVVDLSNGKRAGVTFAEDQTSDFFGPWGSEGKEIRFTSPLLGHGISFPMLISSLRIEKPPFHDDFSFVVARTGSCLNLHDKPSRTATTNGCVPDGTLVARTVVPLENTSQPLGAIVEGPDRWVHIQAPDDNSGWASANYLDWAP